MYDSYGWRIRRCSWLHMYFWPWSSLMAESLSMASMAELPMVVIDVQRSGPSTGMATKVEQSDIDVLAIMHMVITLVSLFLQHLSKNASMKFKKLSTWQKCTNVQLSLCLTYKQGLINNPFLPST